MGGVRLKFHPLFFLLGAVLVVMGKGYTFLSYTVTVIIHEMGHSAVAERYGYVLDDIKLMPYGAALSGRIEGIPAREEVAIALGGPAVNLITAVIFTAVWWLVPQSYFFTEVFVIANLVTACFNLIPVFPLDGGRVMLALLSAKHPYPKAIRTVRVLGAVFAALLTAGFVASFFVGFNPTVGVLAVFIFASTLASAKTDGYMRVYNSTFLTRNLKKGVTVKEVAILCDEPILVAVKKLNANHYYRFLVLDKQLKSMGVLTQAQVEDCAGANGAHITAGEALKKLPRK